MPLVSVIMPVYQRQRAAEAAIASVLSQDVDLELIVVDDGSAEPFVYNGVDPRVRLLRHAVNRGAAAARNTGMAAAQGDWLAFIDSDDVWLAGKLTAQLEATRGHEAESVAFATGFVLVDEATGRERQLIPAASDKVADFAAGCWFCPGSTVLIRRSVAEQIGPMDTAPPRLEDLDWYLRLAVSGGRLAVVPVVGARISVGHKPSLALVEQSAALLRAKWTNLPPRAKRRLDACLALEIASAAMHQNSYGKGLASLAKSLLLEPRTRLHLGDWWRAAPAT